MQAVHGVGPNKKRGFSLIEVLVSLSILLIAVGGMAAAFQYNIFQTVSATNHAQAAIIAQSVFSELNTTVGNWNTNNIEDRFLYNFEGELVDDPDDAYYWVQITLEAPGPGWQAVTIGVNWLGWSAEDRKTGYKNDSANFAYVLEGILSTEVGEINGGAS